MVMVIEVIDGLEIFQVGTEINVSLIEFLLVAEKIVFIIDVEFKVIGLFKVVSGRLAEVRFRGSSITELIAEVDIFGFEEVGTVVGFFKGGLVGLELVKHLRIVMVGFPQLVGEIIDLALFFKFHTFKSFSELVYFLLGKVALLAERVDGANIGFLHDGRNGLREMLFRLWQARQKSSNRIRTRKRRGTILYGHLLLACR